MQRQFLRSWKPALESTAVASIGLLLLFASISTAKNSESTSELKKADRSTTSQTTSLKKGDTAGVFYVTKIAGAEEDGVEEGQELCYRCRYGSRPMVMIFARKAGGKIPKLVEVLDNEVDKNQEAQLRGLVTLLGNDAAEVKEVATKVAEKSGAKNVPVVVAKETKTGPENYKLSESADVTVVVASDSQVVSTHEFTADKIDIAMILNDVKQIVH